MTSWVPYYNGPFSPPLQPIKNKDTAFVVVALGVICLHILMVWFSFLFSNVPPKKEAPVKLVVKTVTLQPKLQPVAQPIATAPPAPVSVSPAPAIVPELIKEEPLPAQEVTKDIVPEKPVSTPLKTEQTASPPKEKIEEQPKVIPETAPVIPIEPPKPQSMPPQKIQEKKPVPKQAPPKLKKPVAAKPTPKENPAPVAKKPIAPAPVKETPVKPGKPVKVEKKEPTPEEIAYREAEKKRQQEVIALREKSLQEQQALLSKTKEKFAKIEETRDKIGSASKIQLGSWGETTLPQQIGQLQIDALPVGNSIELLSAKEVSYRDEVAFRLKQALKLPDLGQVKIKLTLERSGKVLQVQTVSSESEKNKQYIEKTLPTLIFPPFGSNFADLPQYTFVISLNNDY